MYDCEETAKACPRGQIELVEDLGTGLVCNAAFDPVIMAYDTAYQSEQANSAAFRDHLEWAANLIGDKIGLDRLVEVGCGKGTFLNLLTGYGAGIVGFDPSFEGADPRITNGFFGPETGVTGDGIILRHVLEHIENPVEFLHHLAKTNGGGGLIYIEVPCFDWICQNRAWFDIFYEHVNYFRLCDFDRIFGRVVVSGNCFGGQYLYIIADLKTLRRPAYDPQNLAEFPEDFTESLEVTDTTDRDIVWGGASKGVIYAMLRARAGRPVAGVIDINAAKQGKYLAVTGLRVSAPQELLRDLPKSARILIMNPNYTEEIKTMSDNAFTYVEVGT
jgi:SAM-dependent methyltransferase